ncbi:hypothetical protein DIKCMJMK_03845 [Shewanella oneidensis]|nr:hypothetical protein [Shewanella oneidensis]
MQLRQQSQQQLQHFHTVRLILGDQLNAEHTWYQQVDPKVLYLIAELHQENTYVTHHVQKICAFFSAMAQFASELQFNEPPIVKFLNVAVSITRFALYDLQTTQKLKEFTSPRSCRRAFAVVA